MKFFVFQVHRFIDCFELMCLNQINNSSHDVFTDLMRYIGFTLNKKNRKPKSGADKLCKTELEVVPKGFL